MPPAVTTPHLLEVVDLAVHHPVHEGVIFHSRVGTVRAVDGVSFEIAPGETLGLVGESGCGKSTTGRAILRLAPITRGSIRFRGEPLHLLAGERLRRLRRELQMIFQDPYGSLDPRMTVADLVAEPLRAFGEDDVEAKVLQTLDRCGLSRRYVRRYPHEFSGGQRQRVAIARALVLRPSLVVCDEPVSALDVSIRAQILNLLGELQRELGMAYLFIAHDLGAVRHLSHRVAVMYLGKLVELAPAAELHLRPLHPYTQALVSAVPSPSPRAERARSRIVLRGDVPSPLHPPPGCRFHTRCPLHAKLPAADRARCSGEEPKLKLHPGAHPVACHFVGEAS